MNTPSLMVRRLLHGAGRSSSVGRSFMMNPRNVRQQATRTLSTNASRSSSQDDPASFTTAAAAAAICMLGMTAAATSNCDNNTKQSWTPSIVAKENFADTIIPMDELQNNYPTYTMEEVSQNDGTDGKPIWMTYGGVVYDVTKFIANHPGGSEKIMMAAGSSIEPYWHTYRQHFASDLPSRLLEHMVIGRLAETDQDSVDEQMDVIYETSEDPFAHEPVRHKALRVHSEQSMNAETPEELLTENYLTPTPLFYIRHHHPVPFLTTQQIQNYRLEIDLGDGAISKKKTKKKKTKKNAANIKLSLEDLKKLPKTEIVATLQCSGNRRSEYNKYQRTTGTVWGQGALSTAKWGGVLLKDVLDHLGVEPDEAMEHVRFYSLDGVMASVGVEKALNPYGDVLIAYEMNDEILPRDHGYPLRIIIPGYAGIRNVKWLSKIEFAKEEAEGAWQRGLNYKILPPSVTDASDVNITEMPSMMEASIFSGITKMEILNAKKLRKAKPGDVIHVNVQGWAWAGGGRNVVRVDAASTNAVASNMKSSNDDDDSPVLSSSVSPWVTATLKEGSEQRRGRAWAWTFWEAKNVPAIVNKDRTIEIACKAIDSAFNVQPESSDHVWNVRGLGNNSWFRMKYQLPK